MSICLRCGSYFDMKRGKKFCSNICRWAYRNKKLRLTREELIQMAIMVLEGDGYEVKRKGK